MSDLIQNLGNFKQTKFKKLILEISPEEWIFLNSLIFCFPPFDTGDELTDLILQDTLRQVAVILHKGKVELEEANRLELTAAQALSLWIGIDSIIDDVSTQERALYLNSILESIHKKYLVSL